MAEDTGDGGMKTHSVRSGVGVLSAGLLSLWTGVRHPPGVSVCSTRTLPEIWGCWDFCGGFFAGEMISYQLHSQRLPPLETVVQAAGRQMEIPSFQPWLGPAGDQPHPGAPSRRGSGHEEVSRELGPLCQEPGAETSVAVSVISLCLCFCLFGLLLPLSLCCGGWMAEEPAPGLTGQVQSDGQRAGA